MKLYINLLPSGYSSRNKALELLHLCLPQDIRTFVMLRRGKTFGMMSLSRGNSFRKIL